MDAFLLEKCSECLVNGVTAAEKPVALFKSHAQPTPFRYRVATEPLALPERTGGRGRSASRPAGVVGFSFTKASLYSIWPFNSRKARFQAPGSRNFLQAAVCVAAGRADAYRHDKPVRRLDFERLIRRCKNNNNRNDRKG